MQADKLVRLVVFQVANVDQTEQRTSWVLSVITGISYIRLSHFVIVIVAITPCYWSGQGGVFPTLWGGSHEIAV